MPNFHEDYLAIAANEEDMHKVLMRFAANLYAHKEEIGIENEPNRQMMEDLGVPVLGLQREVGFNLDKLAELDLRDLYREVGPLIDSWYMYSFVGAPNPEGSEGAQLGWESSTGSGSEFTNQMTAMANALEESGGSIRLVVQPTGRPVSESATVGLDRYGSNWVLTVRYCTAWEPNTEDLDYFFLGLPAGDYGVAFYDADEYDDYEVIGVFSGLHHGLNTMHATEGEREWDDIERDELKERRERYSSMTKSDITDLPELARMAVACGWSEWGWEDEDEESWEDEDEESCDEEYGGSRDDVEYIDFYKRPSLNWLYPSERDLAKIDEIIALALCQFPWAYNSASYFTEEGKEAANLLVYGDPVLVRSEWGSDKDFCPVEFTVLSCEGEELATLCGVDGLFQQVQIEDVHKNACGALACLLPYLSATVQEVVPLSLRASDEPAMSIRFDMGPIDFAEVMAEIHALLKKRPEDRALPSKGRE